MSLRSGCGRWNRTIGSGLKPRRVAVTPSRDIVWSAPRLFRFTQNPTRPRFLRCKKVIKICGRPAIPDLRQPPAVSPSARSPSLRDPLHPAQSLTKDEPQKIHQAVKKFPATSDKKSSQKQAKQTHIYIPKQIKPSRNTIKYSCQDRRHGGMCYKTLLPKRRSTL